MISIKLIPITIPKIVAWIQNFSFYQISVKTSFAKTCPNIRDRGIGNKCAFQLEKTTTCENHLKWKDCDKTCNLCACSTAFGTTKEHCSGHGTCEATCNKHTCTNAKCKCDLGWNGDKCQNGKIIILLNV